MDKIVEIARFTYPADAQPLMALLRSEGIECYLRNELSSQIMAGYVDVGGARVEILESDVPRAMKIMDLLRIAYFLKLNKCNQWHAER